MAASTPARDRAPAPYATSLEHLRDELGRIDLLVRSQIARARDATGGDAWRGLAISEGEIDALLQRSLGSPPWDLSAIGPSLDDARAAADGLAERIEHRVRASSASLRLAELVARFELERIDLDILLIALAPELDLRYERLYAYLHDDVTRKRPSVDLALHLSCGTLEQRFAARRRFEPGAPLIRHGLLQVVADAAAAPPLLARTIKVDDRIVDWLHGSDPLDPRLARHARRVVLAATLDDLVVAPGVRDQLARYAAELCAGGRAPLLYLQGPSGVGKRTAAAAIARAVGRPLLAVDIASLDGLADDAVETILRMAGREARLTGELLLLDGADAILLGDRRAVRSALLEVAAELPGATLLTGERAWHAGDAIRERGAVVVELALPDAAMQRELWQSALADTPLAEDVDLAIVANRMRLTAGQIHDAAATARDLARGRAGGSARVTLDELGEACRRHSTRRFGSLARKVTARPAWHDLVLPGDRVERLREICDHARHRAHVFERWGFARKLPNGKGLSLLFAGAPGTGKTLAAAVIANELGLDLYQIDLASVVSKWIGETEKHLSRIFDEAERGHGVLFFDEADALFGKRAEVRDAHDRYANIETSFLLQRMEEYEGVVILASNFRRNMDEAFVRRLRFIIEFPLPDERERLQIWERIWPVETPRAPDLDLAVLARRFELAGAYIRNIALAAAFLAAAERTPVGQRHVLHAARREYQKLGKMVDESQFTRLA